MRRSQRTRLGRRLQTEVEREAVGDVEDQEDGGVSEVVVDEVVEEAFNEA